MAKQIRKVVLAILALSNFYFYSVPTAFACIVQWPFNVADMDLAEVIFRGRIEIYEKLPNFSNNTVKMNFLVLQTYKGPHEPEFFDAIWQNSTYGVPEDLSGLEVIVGLAPRYLRPKEFPGLQDQHWILQVPCRAPFMFILDSDGRLRSFMFSSRQERSSVEQTLRERGMIK